MNKDDQIAFLKKEKEQINSLNEALKQELNQLKKMIFGSTSEKHISTLDDNQLNIFGEDEAVEQEDTGSSQPITYTRSNPKKKHPGRHPLPDHLPVEEVTIEPNEDTSGLTKISDEITDTLEYTPASLVIKRTIRPKYAKAHGLGVVIAALPQRPLPKSIAESSLLTHIIVNKFVMHLPFYRQIQGFKRDYNWILSSSTINDWFIQVCTLLDPLYNKLKEKTLSQGYIQADESPIKVLDSDKKGKTHQGYQWVYHNPIDKLILFHYRKGRGMHGPKEILTNYKGILQCDGYSVYDKVGKSKDITLVGCLVHARRKFVDAKENDLKRANHALDIFNNIYKEEALAKGSENRKAYRDQHIKPLFMKLKSWLHEQSCIVLPKSAIGKAISYTINQWDKLFNVFMDGVIELDNNLIENKIRPLALGRKNYLFAGSHESAQRIAMMYSFFATCAANDINPSTWLHNTLDQISDTSILDLDKLIPNKNYT